MAQICWQADACDGTRPCHSNRATQVRACPVAHIRWHGTIVGRDGGDGRNAGPPLAGTGALGAVVEAEFIDVDGTVRRELLSRCWSVAFERVPPVRGFPSFRGQRNRPGLWWFAGTGEHVGHESWLERDRLMALDADAGVVAVAAQSPGGEPLRFGGGDPHVLVHRR